MISSNHQSVHITLFKEKESFFKRSFNKHLLLIFNNLTIFLIFLKIHAQLFNLSLILTKIFFFSLNFYYKYNKNLNLKFYKHYFFTYFNIFFNKIFKMSNKIKNLINIFFIKFFNKIKKINNNFNKKSFVLYNFNVFLIGRNYNIYTGNIIPFYQKKLMWFIGTGLKLDGECSESVLTAEEFNQLIWCNFDKNNIIKIQNFYTNLKKFNIHKRLKHHYYLYLNFTVKYVRFQKLKFIKTAKQFSLKNYYGFYKDKIIKNNNFNLCKNKYKQINLFFFNFFINLFVSLVYTFQSLYSFLISENKKTNLFFYFLNSFYIYLKSINLFMKLLKNNYLNLHSNLSLTLNLNNFYSINLLNIFFFNNLFENKKLYFLFFNFFINKKLKNKKTKINYLKLLNRNSTNLYIKRKFLNKLTKYKKIDKFSIYSKLVTTLKFDSNNYKQLLEKILQTKIKMKKTIINLKKLKQFKRKKNIKKKRKLKLIKKLKKKLINDLRNQIINKKRKFRKNIFNVKNTMSYGFNNNNTSYTKKKKRYGKYYRLNAKEKKEKFDKREKARQQKQFKNNKKTKNLKTNQLKSINLKVKNLKINKNELKNKIIEIVFSKKEIENTSFLKKHIDYTKVKKFVIDRINQQRFIIVRKIFKQVIKNRINKKLKEYFLLKKKKLRFEKKKLKLKKKDVFKLSKLHKEYIIFKLFKKTFKVKTKPVKRLNFRARMKKKIFKFRSKIYIKKSRFRKKVFNKLKKKEKLKKKLLSTYKSNKISNHKLKKMIKIAKITKNYKLFKKNYFKSIYIDTITNKRYLNYILITICNKHFFLSKLELIFFNNLYFFKMFSIFSFLFKLNYFFINIFVKKYEFFYYYGDLINFNENLKDLNKFIIVLKENKFNFIYFYKMIFEKILLFETHLKQFFFNIIKLKKNCFKYKYFFFNIIKYLIILKKKYLYFTTLDLFSKIIDKKYFLSEKFNSKFMNLCALNKKCILTLKQRMKNKYNISLIKKKTKKYYRYIARGLIEYKKKNKKILTLKSTL